MNAPSHEATPFIGRGQELAALCRELESSRLVTLIGAGGVGKSRLARQLYVDAENPPPVWSVDLSGVLDAGVVQIVVADALGLRTQPGDRQAELICSFFGSDPAVLLLDNCEQVHEACAELVVELLGPCPQLRILATSREPVGVRGEHVFRVPPLHLPPEPDGPTPQLREVEASEAVQLFVDRAQDALPEFELTDDNASDVATLCRLLDGVPLALELAAARTRVLSPAEMTSRLKSGYFVLDQGFSDQPDRQRSLEASVRWSHDLCTEQERLLWRRLSVFDGPFELTSAEEVCSDSALPRTHVLEVLSSLVDKSIIFRDPRTEPASFRMLEPLRWFGEAQLREHEDAAAWQRRHRDHFVTLAADVRRRWMGHRQVGLLRWCDRNLDNFRAVLDRTSSQTETAAQAMRVCLDLENYWVTSGRLSEGRHWLEAALAHAEGTAAERASAYALAGYLAALQGDDADAEELLDQGRRLAPDASSVDAGGQVPQARVAFSESMHRLFRGEAETAVQLARQSAEICAQAGDAYGEAVAIVQVGMALSAQGLVEEAIETKRAWLERTDWAEEKYLRSIVMWMLALDARVTGDLEWAQASGIEALRLEIELDDRIGTALTLDALTSIAAAAGKLEQSATLLGASDRAWSRMGPAARVVPYVVSQRELAQQLVSAGMRQRDLDAAFEAGARLPIEEVLGLLQREDTEERHPLADTPLTAREREVALLLGEGMTNQQIADRLVISLRTAQGHVENILRKLDLRTRAQVAAWVARTVGRG